MIIKPEELKIVYEKEDDGRIRPVYFIDAEPVRHGRWIFSPDHSEGVCTHCNFKIYGRPYQNTYLIVPYNYCPNCGAKMDGERRTDE